ncbi:MAG: hypothetical protein IKY67_11895 [Paludibacteraceae bacterium]|nr:hypothetical protein [Paludibacteraceae bacterium]
MNNFIKELEQIPNQTPREVFEKLIDSSNYTDPILKILGILAWNILSSEIDKNKTQIPFYYHGLQLCKFCQIAIECNHNDKITTNSLELGTECIKSLNNIYIDQNPNFDKQEKENRKLWFNTFLDIWKEYIKEVLTEEKRLLFLI